MARFKKKKSKPTPDPTGKKEKSVEEPTDTPEIGNDVSLPPNIPPVDPASAVTEKNENAAKLNRLFWLRVGLAVMAGTAATFIFENIEGEDRRWASIAFMVIVFFATIIIAKGMKMQLPASDRKKIVTQGIGSYIFIYLFIWIVSYTLVNMGDIPGGIPSPIQ